MNIRTKLILRFSAIVATILIVFSIAVYFLSENYRKEEFYTRLESRAITTARLYVTVQEVDENMLRIIERNSIHAMFQERVLIFNPENKLIYSSLDDLEVPYSPELLARIREKTRIEYTLEDIEHVGLVYSGAQGDFVVISSAYDRYGRSKLQNLRNVLLTGLFVGILMIVLAGAVFAGQVLQPLARINEEVSNISAGNLSQRVDEGNRHDEIARLAMNFNDMLHRLEAAFEVQQQFVSNASHEMRNPLAAITTQLQLILDKKRSPEEYEDALQSLLDDTQTLVELTNGLLTLAQSGLDKQRFQFEPVRVDEVLFLAQNELGKLHPEYRFNIDFETLPEDEQQLTIPGNEQLLKTAFLNLMDNACKFSQDHTVRIRVAANDHSIKVSLRDKGIGIPPEEQSSIFTPFYRSSNVQSTIKGHGIGLALSRRIIQLHNGIITFKSALQKGSSFEVQLPR